MHSQLIDTTVTLIFQGDRGDLGLPGIPGADGVPVSNVPYVQLYVPGTIRVRYELAVKYVKNEIAALKVLDFQGVAFCRVLI